MSVMDSCEIAPDSYTMIMTYGEIFCLWDEKKLRH